MSERRIVGSQPVLTVDGDGTWDYACPKCYQPSQPAIEGRGRSCPLHAPLIAFRMDGAREWFAVTCGQCGFHEDDPAPEPIYAGVQDMTVRRWLSLRRWLFKVARVNKDPRVLFSRIIDV